MQKYALSICFHDSYLLLIGKSGWMEYPCALLSVLADRSPQEESRSRTMKAVKSVSLDFIVLSFCIQRSANLANRMFVVGCSIAMVIVSLYV